MKCGIRLPPPKDCPNEIYKLMLKCWGKNNSIARKQPQAIMRDINQISMKYIMLVELILTLLYAPSSSEMPMETMTRMAVFIEKKANQIVNRKRVWSLITLILLRTIIVSQFKSS